MEEMDPNLPYTPVDKHTAAEFLARHEALRALIDEAVDASDTDKLGIYQEALAQLKSDNPGEGAYHGRSDYMPALTSLHEPPVSQMRFRDHVGLFFRLPAAERKHQEEVRKRAQWTFAVIKEIEARSGEPTA